LTNIIEPRYCADVNFLPQDIDDSKPLIYKVRLLTAQKRDVLFLVAVAVAVVLTVRQYSQNNAFCAAAAILLLASMWKVFIPVRYELNADGIVREMLGSRRFIAWNQIRTYQVYHNGIFLLPPNDRFYAEVFRGGFLPVPPALSAEVLYRFRVSVNSL
jgi:hypothetical protein